jgi:hypothetical protein
MVQSALQIFGTDFLKVQRLGSILEQLEELQRIHI